MRSNSFKNKVTYKLFTKKSYIKSGLHEVGPSVYSFDEISVAELDYVTFSCSSKVLIFKLFLSSLLYRLRFQHSQVLVVFLFSKRSNAFLIYCSLLFVVSFFPLFIICVVHFSMSNSIPIICLYILIVRSRVSSSFSFFGNILI